MTASVMIIVVGLDYRGIYVSVRPLQGSAVTCVRHACEGQVRAQLRVASICVCRVVDC